MKPLRFLLCAAFCVAGPCRPATADDKNAKDSKEANKDAIIAAEKAAHDAPACRIKATATDPASGLSTTVTIDVVYPDSIRMKSESGGEVMMEMVTDGRKVFVSREGGAMTEAPAQMTAMLKQVREQFSGESVARSVRNVKRVGHETIGGVATTVYTFDTDVMGSHTTTKEWIADMDHRPLKIEGETSGDPHGNPEAGGGAGKQKSTVTYEYDPGIKIVLPAS